MLEDVIKDYNGVEVDAMEVYGKIFRLGEGLIQKDGEPPGKFKANPLGYYRNEREETGHYRILFEDTFQSVLKELQRADFAIVNGLTYFGRKNKQDKASKMFSMIFDIDGVTDKTLNAFLNGAFSGYEIYPVPNFIALSGHGIHLYYVFDEPISLYPYIKIQLKNFKYALTKRLWNQYTSKSDAIQYQGINQGFRPIGGKTKIPGVRVRAFKLTDHLYTLSELGRYVPEADNVDTNKLYKERRLSWEEAKAFWPEWYDEVVEGGRAPKTWIINRRLYEWWKRKIYKGATVGHRYFSIMCLAIYAAKCDIEEAELEKDARAFMPFLSALNPDDPFTESDMKSALECFDKKYCKFPREDMERISGIEIPPNLDRHYRRQRDHLREPYFPDSKGRLTIMNPCNQRREDVLRYMRENGEIHGRPKGIPGKGRIKGSKNKKSVKAEQIAAWRKEHPEGKKIDCERYFKEKGEKMSRPTIIKYW